MATAKQVFAALPHVEEVWITEDGEHHLDSFSGGVKHLRNSKDEEETPPKGGIAETPKATAGGKNKK